MSEDKECFDKECFIIMPITTPETMIEKYRDGEVHFKHVLECLFIPAIEKAGYIPKPPNAKGSDLIHAEIIKNLETADIVLCDMSCLNPNVFFEFGIRTSLNKPVCIVKDEFIESAPFDAGVLNHQDYKSSLEPWELEAEIKKLTKHLAESSESSKGVNTLWKYFGMKTGIDFKAEPYEVEAGTEGKLDFIKMQMDQLQKKIDETFLESKSTKAFDSDFEALNKDNIRNRVLRKIYEAWPMTCARGKTTCRKSTVKICYTGELEEEDYNVFMTIAAKNGINLQLIREI